MSLSFIENLNQFADTSRPVNRGVMPLAMNKHLCLIIVAIFIGVQGGSLPERGQMFVASQQASKIREVKSGKSANSEAPAECLAISREFIAYIFRQEPDIAKDKEAQNRWLTEYLRKGLAHRQEIYAAYVKRLPDTPEQPPSNADFVGSWDYPTTYSIQGSRRYDERALVDIMFSWGEKTQYPGDTRLVSYIFIHEGNTWKLDDIYTFRGEFTAGAESLSEVFWRNDYP
jgi:hypothetical protein